MYTEDQLRHPALWTEQLRVTWVFHAQTAIVGLARPQPVSHSSNPMSVSREIHSMSSFILENPYEYTDIC